jgi:uncharacterized iron-regulated protein
MKRDVRELVLSSGHTLLVLFLQHTVSALCLHALARQISVQTDSHNELKQLLTRQGSLDKGSLDGRVVCAQKYESVLKIPGCCFFPQSIHADLFELPEV